MRTRSALKGSSALKALAFVGALALPGMASADFVTLRSADGTVNLSGTFVAFEDNFYIISTDLGQLRVSAERVSCSGAGCPTFNVESADVMLAGSDTVGQGMMPLLLEGFAGFLEAEATVTVADGAAQMFAEFVGDAGFGEPIGSYLVSSTRSSDAFTSLLDKSSEIGMSARRIRPEEAQQLARAGAGDMTHPKQEHIVAVDSLVVITHPSNPVASLTTQQLAGIYAGRITNWNQVGGADAPITVLDRPVDSSTRQDFMRAVVNGPAPAPLSNAQIRDDNTATAIAVNSDRNAIGVVSYAFQRGAKPMPIVSECGLTMVPDAFSARTEEYGLQRRLYLYTRDDNLSDSSRDLLTFATSEAADRVIAKAGFIDLGIDVKEQTLDGQRAISLSASTKDAAQRRQQKDMLAMMKDYDRLSTTFRFRTGSSALDERGIVDMERLASYLENTPEGTEVMVVGFTDSVGSFANNARLSQRRAAQVLSDLKARAGDRLANVSLNATGFSELAPAACNTNENGKRINRRVEIWINVPKA